MHLLRLLRSSRVEWYLDFISGDNSLRMSFYFCLGHPLLIFNSLNPKKLIAREEVIKIIKINNRKTMEIPNYLKLASLKSTSKETNVTLVLVKPAKQSNVS